jgi:hypothetical protein
MEVQNSMEYYNISDSDSSFKDFISWIKRAIAEIEWEESDTCETTRLSIDELQTMVDPNNKDFLKTIFKDVRDEIWLNEYDSQYDIVYNTSDELEIELCNSLAACVGYRSWNIYETTGVKYVGCHKYDDYGDVYEAYCACNKVPKEIRERGISHTEHDSDGDEDFDNHFYPVPKKAVIGIKFHKKY